MGRHTHMHLCAHSQKSAIEISHSFCMIGTQTSAVTILCMPIHARRVRSALADAVTAAAAVVAIIIKMNGSYIPLFLFRVLLCVCVGFSFRLFGQNGPNTHFGGDRILIEIWNETMIY